MLEKNIYKGWKLYNHNISITTCSAC